MKDFTPHQKKIVERYYDHRDAIMLTKLQEIASELYLATTPAAQKRLWKRAESAMNALKIAPAQVQHIVSQGRPELLANHLRDWLADAGKGGTRK